MSEFTNSYSSDFSEQITGIILNFENDFKEKVKSGIYVDTKIYFNDMINKIYNMYVEEGGTESGFYFQLDNIVRTFNFRNMEYIQNNYHHVEKCLMFNIGKKTG